MVLHPPSHGRELEPRPVRRITPLGRVLVLLIALAAPAGLLTADSSSARFTVDAAVPAVISAWPASDYFGVSGFTPGENVDFTIRDAGGEALASGNKPADTSGLAGFSRPQDFSVDLAAGMEVSVSQGTITKTLILASITIASFSPATDTVAGTAAPGAQLDVYLWTPAGNSPTIQVTAGADGTWSVTFAPYDITYAATAYAAIRDVDGDATRVSRQAPVLKADFGSDAVNVYGFAPGGVELTIRESPGGTVLASASKQADGTGYTWFGSQDFSVDLAAGMELTASQGALTKTLTLAPLTINAISPDTDSVAGTAPPGAQLEVYVYNLASPSSPTKPVTAAADGTWSLDFAPFDITYTTTASANLRDSDGDTTSLSRTPPRVDASLNADSISVYGFTLGGDVELTIRQSPGGTVLASASKQADGTGYTWFGAQDFSVDLVAGMQLTVSQGTVTKTLTLEPLTVTAISPDTDTVAGTASAGSQLEVDVVNVASSSSPKKLVTAAADGTWSLNFAPYDITYTATVSAKLRDSDGDATYVYRQAPVLNASLNNDSIGAFGFTPGSNVQFTIRSAGGTVLATGVKEADSYGYAWFRRPGDHDVDLIAGMQVTVESGSITKEMTIAPLTASLEPDADTVAGTAPAGAQLEVYVYNQGSSGSPTSRVTADGNGNWSVDFTGSFDITHTAVANVALRDSEGDATSLAKQVPRIAVWLSYAEASAHGFMPGSSVHFTIRSAGGAVLAEDVETADSYGYAWFGVGIDLSAGMKVTVSDGTSTKELTLAALAIAYVNQVRDVVAGTAPAGARLEVFVYDHEGYGATKQVTADSEGKWSADFTGAYDIADTGGAYVTHYDDDGDATSQVRSAESDTTTPVAAFDAGPSGLTNDATPSFSFSADEPASFECRVDGAALADCSSPHTTAALGDGSHTFDVRAIDMAGNIGAVATRAFAVDTTPPVATIDAGPSGTTTVATPTIAFSAGEPASFECRLDGNAFTACTSPYTTAPLADGVHSFELRATDTAGNIGAAVATTFTVATPTPGGGGGGGGGGAGNPDLSVSIVANRAAVEIGGSVDLTVTVRNTGPQSGTGVVLAISLPDSATLLGPPAFDRGSGCTGTAPLSCNLDFLPAGVQSTVRFSIGLRQAGPQTVTAKVTSVETDLAAADNVSAVTIAVADATPPPKPVLFRPVLGAPTYVPKKPVAGQALRVALVVRRSDNGSLLRSGKVNCDPFITGRLIRHTESFRNGVVRISLKVPQAAKGKLLRMKVTFRIGDRPTTRLASIRLK